MCLTHSTYTTVTGMTGLSELMSGSQWILGQEGKVGGS